MNIHSDFGITSHQLKLLKLLIDKQWISPDILKYDETFLSKTVQKRLQEASCRNAADYLKLIQVNKDEVSSFLNSLLIGYSEFFRNALTFSVLGQIIIPSILQKKKESKRKEIRIWSAACSAGQESYSLAMLMEEINNGDEEKFSYRIFASDQNETLVNEARNGLYSENALSNLNLKRINQWFTRKGDTYAVKQELKNNMDFSVFDLFNKQNSCPPARMVFLRIPSDP